MKFNIFWAASPGVYSQGLLINTEVPEYALCLRYYCLLLRMIYFIYYTIMDSKPPWRLTSSYQIYYMVRGMFNYTFLLADIPSLWIPFKNHSTKKSYSIRFIYKLNQFYKWLYSDSVLMGSKSFHRVSQSVGLLSNDIN